MAPRGRQRRRSNTRMDAAIDAMKPFGFPTNMIVKTIKELINVYGEEGWPFIEDASYRVLLEAILEKVDEKGASDSKKPAAETSSGTLEPSCFSVNPFSTMLQTSNSLDSASEANEALRTVDEKGTSDSKKPAAETSSGTLETSCSSVNPFSTALQTSNSLECASEANEALCSLKLTNESVEAEGNVRRHVPQPWSSNHSVPPPSHNSPLLDSNITRKRRPYYGWICSDDEEDLVELRPGPLGEEIENWLSSFRERRKRWDVKPEDM